MIEYRSFHNDDPPALAEVWNASFTGRGAVVLPNAAPLERHAYAKPYFDPAGLIVALDEGACVGFAHAGFGPNDQETALAFTSGAICLIAVKPSHRRQGVARELLRHCESYLRGRGARTIYAGPMRPVNPFYLGLYGGSELPGFLASDAGAGPFFEAHGYRGRDTCLVFQRRLANVNIVDARFAALRRRFTVRVVSPMVIGTWWQECVLGPLEPVEIRLEDARDNRVAALAAIWEMEGFSVRWGMPAAGIIDVNVREDLRRQGLAKFLLAQILRHLQEQYFGIAEVQTMEVNEPAVKLYKNVGFEQVDTGRVYRLETKD